MSGPTWNPGPGPGPRPPAPMPAMGPPPTNNLPPWPPSPKPQRSGPPAWVFAVIGVVLLALVGVLLWLFLFRDGETDTAEPGATQSPTQSPTVSPSPSPTGEPPSTPVPVPGGHGQGPGGGAAIPKETLPKTIGEWRHVTSIGDSYIRDGAVIMVASYGKEPELIDAMRERADNVRDVATGFCSDPEEDYLQTMCLITPGKSENTVLNLHGDVSLDEIVEVAEGIGNHR